MFGGVLFYADFMQVAQKTVLNFCNIADFVENVKREKIFLQHWIFCDIIIRREYAQTCVEAGGGHSLKWEISAEYVRF